MSATYIPLLGDRHWADEEISTEERHRFIFEYVKTLEEKQSEVTERHLRHGWLYDRCMLIGLGGDLQIGGGGGWFDRMRDSGVVENVVESCVDTATSLIARHRPRPVFLTDGGNFSQKQQAKQATRYFEGLFQVEQLHKKRVSSFQQGAVFGTKAFHVYPDYDRERPCFEQIIPDELIVDEEACRDAQPREVFRRKFVDKAILAKRYPKAAEAIARAHSQDRAYTSFRMVGARQLVCIEAYKLPSEPDADDGRHSLVVDGATLYDEEWSHDYFPYVWNWWRRRLTGFYGVGIPEQLASIQQRLNYLYAKVALGQDRIAVPRIFWPHANMDAVPKMNRTIGAMIPYNGRTPPIFMTPVAFGPEIYNQIEQLKADAYRLCGISEMSAHATREPGIEAGIALRELRDVQTSRYSIQEQAEEDYVLDLARAGNRVAREMRKEGVKLSTMYKDRDGMRPVELPDLDEEAYVMSIEAGSMLGLTVSGRFSKVLDILSIAPGTFTPKQILSLFELPDVTAEVSLETADLDNADWVLERLEKGHPVTPEPFMNLLLVQKRVQFARCKWDSEGADEDVLENSAAFLEGVQYLLDQAAKAAAPPPAMPGAEMAAGMPPAMPGPAPQEALPPELVGALA